MRTAALDSSTSDSSERLLQRGREGQYRIDFGDGGVYAIKHMFLQKVSASHEELSSPWRTLVFFRRHKNWAHKVVSWKYPTIWRPVLPGFSLSSECIISALYPELLWESRKSAAATIDDLILIEVDGKCHYVADMSKRGLKQRSRLLLGIQARLTTTLQNKKKSTELIERFWIIIP